MPFIYASNAAGPRGDRGCSKLLVARLGAHASPALAASPDGGRSGVEMKSLQEA